MSSAFWSELAKLDDNLQIIQAQVEWLRAGLEFDDQQLSEQLTEARGHGAAMRDLVRAERSDANWNNREGLERVIHELEIAAQERKNQQRRTKLLELAGELDAGTIKHRLETRAAALMKLRQDAVKQVRAEAALTDQVKELPGPRASQWLHWACNLQEEKDGFVLSRLRKEFPALDRFVGGMEESYWVPASAVRESSSPFPDSASKATRFPTTPRPGGPNLGPTKPVQNVKPPLDKPVTRSGSNGEAIFLPSPGPSAEAASLTETARRPEPATRWQAATAAVGNGASKLPPPRLNYCNQCGSSYRGEFHVCPIDQSVAREKTPTTATRETASSAEAVGDTAVAVAPARELHASAPSELAAVSEPPATDSSGEAAESEFERLKALVGDTYSVEDDDVYSGYRQRVANLLSNQPVVITVAAVGVLALAGIIGLIYHFAAKGSSGPAPAPQTVSAKVPDVVPDTTIQKGVEDKLAALKGSSVQVAVQDGVVTLTGKTPAKADLVKAETMAAEVQGVKQVTNKLQVETSTAKGRAKH